MFYTWQINAIVATVLAILLLVTTSKSDVPRPRGVSLVKASLYHPSNTNNWNCLDNSKTIKYIQVNDNYCDCIDGSDEPGTSACDRGRFHCENVGFKSMEIPSSRVNDGICDCCDGSDEYAEHLNEPCPNTCQELGRVELEQRRSEAELHKRGAAKRSELILKGKQLRSERDLRRSELEKRRLEQEAIKTEKEELKRNAEAVETEALEFYKEQQREQEAEVNKNEEVPETMRAEAEASFTRYDANKDGFVEITELQVDMTLDRDRNGVVTVEEAKYFLDERDRIDLESFVALSWPRIKPIQMLAQGLFKPPVIDDHEPEEETESPDQQIDQQSNIEQSEEELRESNDEHQNREDADDEEEEAYEDEEDADVGVGSVSEETTTSAPEYDPETQRLIDLANEARRVFSDVEREIREIDNEIKEIDEQIAKDYGPNEEYGTMDGECYKFEDREYVYTLCPFDRASQKQRSGGSETTLGRWDQWIGEGDNKYTKQKYSHGASCWNGPQRSALVELKCALEHKITSVSEPNRCEYFFAFQTPAACDDAVYIASNDQNLHDEL